MSAMESLHFGPEVFMLLSNLPFCHCLRNFTKKTDRSPQLESLPLPQTSPGRFINAFAWPVKVHRCCRCWRCFRARDICWSENGGTRWDDCFNLLWWGDDSINSYYVYWWFYWCLGPFWISLCFVVKWCYWHLLNNEKDLLWFWVDAYKPFNVSRYQQRWGGCNPFGLKPVGLIIATRQNNRGNSGEPVGLPGLGRLKNERLVQREPHGLYDVGHADDGPYAHDGSDDGFRQRLGLGQLGMKMHEVCCRLNDEKQRVAWSALGIFSGDLGRNHWQHSWQLQVNMPTHWL